MPPTEFFTVSIFCTISASHADNYRDNSNWLNNVSDNTKISDLSIPFSHDSFMWNDNMINRGSASTKGPCKCQDGNIDQQFYVGNRGFDIRTYVEDKNQRIGIAHGDTEWWAESDIQLEEAFKQFDNLLNKHPREFLFFRIAIERNIDGDNGNCDAYVSQANNIINKYSDRFITYRDGLTVGDVRGKFLIGYKSNGKGHFEKKGVVDPFSKFGNMNQWFKTIYSYDGGVNELMGRFDAINRNKKSAFVECNRPYKFFENFLKWGQTPYDYAEIYNPKVEGKLLDIRFAGMVSHDFSNHWWYMPNRIINLNFK